MATQKKSGAKKTRTRVRATKHEKDTRANIPTAELESFAEEDEKKPAKLLYPRDTSLDPQLVWKGKDEQDSSDLEVPAVPIYIQETIEPQAVIEDLRRRSKQRAAEAEPTLFADPFEELEFEQRVDFYRHSGKWTNRMILGDSLLVMASLAEKEGLKGQVQMIYIDPPYGIKFGSNWQVSTRKRDVRDGKATDATRQPEQVRAFRDTWELGIHSYLAYLRDRLVVAHDLLAESGSVFVQIGDENVHLVRSLLDEVFGSENFCAVIAFQTTTGLGAALIPGTFDFLLWYAREKASVRFSQVSLPRTPQDDQNLRWVELTDGTRRRMSDSEVAAPGLLPPDARIFRPNPLTSQAPSPTSRFEYEFDGQSFYPTKGAWKTTRDGLRRLDAANRLMVQGNTLSFVRYLDDFPFRPINNVWDDTRQSGFATAKIFIVQTNEKVIERCLLMTTGTGDLVLDPTCGSGTSAVVAEEWGRRWITIDTSRVALALARTRLMTSKFPYYFLADSSDGATKEAELVGHIPTAATYGNDIKKGFVYERVPHVTLKSIANNPDIKEGMTREETSAAIARHTETELLYDRPYEDKNVVRVTGPFTVESLSPHRVLVTGHEDEEAATQAIATDSGRFVDQILDELRAAGVQNTYKGERLVFDTLNPYAGVYVQATGSYRENGKTMAAAVAIGPEYGTVGKELVRDAAKEAVEFADILIVCGFAFEALVEEESKIGRLRILKAKMNPDMQMPDLLKKTGAGNLFMLFGEPDISVSAPDADEMVTVEIRGLDIYDPTTGQVRSNTTDDIACWFVDTDYNGETFFVRHAYFLGGDDPCEKLKRALKADIDEEAWASLYSTTSRPFPKPSTGKIAVKVINHYGDEILKVYEVG